uniref:Uncharacterized protein n=1 Tax=Lepeophtheirus salmonis TaxID=72036 RepID=A0A0K2TYI6_LEPSM
MYLNHVEKKGKVFFN